MTKSTYPEWIFDNSPIPDPFGYGEEAVQFLRRLRHPASTAPKNALNLTPWQERIIRRIYGPRHPDGRRIVKDVFFLIGRGNRKTSLAAAMAILHLYGPEKVPRGQIIFAACNRDQAGIGFQEAADLVAAGRHLSAVSKIYAAKNAPNSIHSTLDGSTLKAVSSDGKAQNGMTPTFVLVDEIHAWASSGRELWKALRTGLLKRKDANGMLVVATTAGRGHEGLAAERYRYARKVALGEIDDPAFLPVLFEMQEGDDWTDEAVWHRCNPGLAFGFQDLDAMRIDAKRAETDLSAMYDFQQDHLCRWMGHSTTPLFNFGEYDARCFADDEADLEELPCYLGVDYAQSGDLAAVVAAWRHPDGQVTLKPWFFVQGEGLEDRERLEDAPYRQWIADGLVIEVPGPVVTQQAVQAKIKEICARHMVEEVGYDPWKFRVAATDLLNDGINMVEVRQGLATMGPANGELIRAVNGRLIRHDGNPVLRNHFAGVAAVVNDTGLIRLAKADPQHGHIDGAVAASMAVGRLAAGESNQSSYNAPGASLLTF